MNKTMIALVIVWFILGFVTGWMWRKEPKPPESITFTQLDNKALLDSSRAFLKTYNVSIPILTIDSLGNKPDTLIGDINKDGKIDKSDLTIMLEIMLYAKYADVNHDKIVNINDLKYLVNFYSIPVSSITK